MPILESLAASPLATTATFSKVHFSISEAEYSSFVATSDSSAQVVIEISTVLIAFTYFCSASSTGTGLISSTLTISSVVFPIFSALPRPFYCSEISKLSEILYNLFNKSQISITFNNCISRFEIRYNSIGEIEEERLTFNTQFTHISTHF